MQNTTTQYESEANNPRIRNRALRRKGIAALEAGDHATSRECLRQMYRDADDLLYLKRVLGREYIERIGMDTTPAEEKYGKDWLDRDI